MEADVMLRLIYYLALIGSWFGCLFIGYRMGRADQRELEAVCPECDGTGVL